jgi:hypothetical protein
MMREIFRHNDKAYYVLRRKIETFFQDKSETKIDMELVKMYRDSIGSDHVLKDGNIFIFCETIEDAKIVE